MYDPDGNFMATKTKFRLDGLYWSPGYPLHVQKGVEFVGLVPFRAREGKSMLKGGRRKGYRGFHETILRDTPVFKVKDSIKGPISMVTDNRN